MAKIIALLMVLFLLVGCQDQPTRSENPKPPPENQGTTKTFTVMVDCQPVIGATDANAQKYCVDLGYTDFTKYTIRYECGSYGWGRGVLATVTCWKP